MINKVTQQVKKKRMKVLMLGWEYPPHISGGLGVATAGLAKALSQYVDLQLILPDNMVLSDWQTTSKNTPPVETLHSNSENTRNAPAPFQAYVSYELPKLVVEGQISQKVQEAAAKIRQSASAKTGKNLYGNALMEKVVQYAKEASKIAKSASFDVIHAHDWMTFPAALKIQKKTGKPLVIHVHSLETDRTTNPNVRNPIFKIEQKAIAAADLVIPVSDYTKQSIEEHYVKSVAECNAIHNGISAFTLEENDQETSAITPLLAPIPKKKKAKKKAKIQQVLFVGRITAQKGVETFIRTAIKLLEQRENLRFTLAGLGDQLEKMMQLVEDSAIADLVEFKGFVQQDELKELLQEADLLFMPSVSEPFGLAALEAAQFGLPIVISNQSGVIEVLPGVLTAEYWDSKTFARHINVLLEYKSIRKAFGKANKKALKKRSWNQVALKVLNAYQKLSVNSYFMG